MKAIIVLQPLRSKHRSKYFLILLAFLISLFSISSCSDDLKEEECCPECISPEGGKIEVVDQSSTIFGTSITVPPGEINICGNLWIDENEFIYFPVGFKPFHEKSGFKIGTYNIPKSTRMEIRLPRHHLIPKANEILCAFYSDYSLDKWHIVLPDEINDDYIIINTSEVHSEWSWGIVDIVTTDEEYIEPLMVEINGEEEWELIKNSIQIFYDSISTNETSLSCVGLDIIYKSLNLSIEEKEEFLKDYQLSIGNNCGDCDATELHFYLEVVERISLELKYEITKLMIKKSRGGFMVKITIWTVGLYQLNKIQKGIENLDCDHICFYNQWNNEYKKTLGEYIFASGIKGLIDLGKNYGYIDCP